MTFRLAVLLIFLAISLSGTKAASAQDAASRPDTPEITASGKEYRSHCLKNRIQCQIAYGETDETSTRILPRGSLRAPGIEGITAVVLVLAMLGLAIGLWLRFGNSGALLASAPRELKRNTPAPDGWRLHEEAVQLSSGDLIDRIAAMPDQREAMILLLRHCLLHAADIGATRLARSDTERCALHRLPGTLPGRQALEELLGETELVHYGGRILEPTRFAALLETARSFLAQPPVRHA